MKILNAHNKAAWLVVLLGGVFLSQVVIAQSQKDGRPNLSGHLLGGFDPKWEAADEKARRAIEFVSGHRLGSDALELFDHLCQDAVRYLGSHGRTDEKTARPARPVVAGADVIGPAPLFSDDQKEA